MTLVSGARGANTRRFPDVSRSGSLNQNLFPKAHLVIQIKQVGVVLPHVGLGVGDQLPHVSEEQRHVCGGAARQERAAAVGRLLLADEAPLRNVLQGSDPPAHLLRPVELQTNPGGKQPTLG